MHLPKLPPNASYIYLNNPQRRNALSIAVLQELKNKLVQSFTSPSSGQLRILPPFKKDILSDLEYAARRENRESEQWKKYGWLVDASEWRKERAGLPDVLVLRSEGPVFCSGHDLKELSTMSHDDVKRLFTLCAEIMTLIRRSPAIVVCPIQGLATAAGFQLAMTTDYPISLASTEFSLPGAKIGLPCTSPSTAVSRRLPPGQAYRLLVTAEPVTAADIPGSVDVVRVPDDAQLSEKAAAFEGRVEAVVKRLAGMAAQPQALGKWSYWTQLGIKGSETDSNGTTEFGGDGYEAAASWAGRAMALHAKSTDAKEGIDAFLSKRTPSWTSRL
ncbi:ClpP/crotonase-like domain-containing protein [Ilyonectria robusta]|uniref:ClpP/crotonase-like domain-containing protein n=1 Tax=Ilyonectria robusta TaxID=1079257 RepID=UPI001E8E122E|nr:ClpP/crotonase-like domain-containing protein [Ilyonectria robusta]KAH8734269.1 ClpP/crotonase-like domain-containing protein [Ilyonectria robusta]